MTKKLEVLANIAVIVTSVVLCSVLAKQYFFSGAPKQAAAATQQPPSPFANNPARGIRLGTKISLPGIDWSKSNRTVLLVLSTTCRFCTESAPFYQRLQQQKPNNVRLVALFPQPIESGRDYLNKLGVSVSDVFQSSLGSVGASGTPTLLLINHDGALTDSWVGKLAESEAAKVINRINEGMAQ